MQLPVSACARVKACMEDILSETVGEVRGKGDALLQLHDSILRQLPDSISRQLHDSISRQLPDSISRQLHDSISRQLHDSNLRQLHNSISRQLHDSFLSQSGGREDRKLWYCGEGSYNDVHF